VDKISVGKRHCQTGYPRFIIQPYFTFSEFVLTSIEGINRGTIVMTWASMKTVLRKWKGCKWPAVHYLWCRCAWRALIFVDENRRFVVLLREM